MSDIKGSSKKEGNGRFPLPLRTGQSWGTVVAREIGAGHQQEIPIRTRKPRNGLPLEAGAGKRSLCPLRFKNFQLMLLRRAAPGWKQRDSLGDLSIPFLRLSFIP